MNRYLKWTAGIFGTVILGAIGSGVWDWILSDLFSWVGRSLISFASSLSQSYLDSLYSDIWKGENYTFLKEIFAINFAIYLMFPFILILSIIKRKNKGTSSNNSSTKKTKLYIPGILGLALLFIFIIKVWETEFTVKAATLLKANIAIVSPHVDQKDRLELLAKFRLINDQNSAQKLRAALEKVASKKNINLHSMESI